MSDKNIKNENMPENGQTDDKKHKVKSVKFAKKVFRAIDILYKHRQNTCPFISKKDREDIACIKNIVYDGEAAEVCVLDVYKKDPDEKKPAIIIIHGGGFSAGDKKYRTALSYYFAYNGYVAISINYGLAPDYLFPQPLKHIVNALNYIYDNADDYGIDRERIVLHGDSSGGYYAAMAAAFNGNKALGEAFGFSPKFKIFGAVFNCGIFDIEPVKQLKLPFGLADGVILSITDKRISELDGYEYRDIFVPVEQVTGEFPPSLFIYSDNDLFCKGQADTMMDKLMSVGVYSEKARAKNRLSNHCFSLTWRSADAVSANAHMLSFLRRLVSGNILYYNG